jgi:transcription termination/antitermination protein NusG
MENNMQEQDHLPEQEQNIEPIQDSSSKIEQSALSNEAADADSAAEEMMEADSSADSDDAEASQEEEAKVLAMPTIAAKETKWYVLRVVSGKERKLKEYLDLEVRRNSWGHIISQILCPMEKIVKMAAGKRSERDRILYPGYILLEAATGKLDDNIVSAVASLNGVIHFLGKENPISLRKSEVNKMFGKMDEVAEMGGMGSQSYLVGEVIKIIDGPFNDFNGTIQEVNDEKKKMKVEVKIFGRSQPVDLNYIQVEKVS